VWSEKTTPQPNVSPGRLRSITVTWWAGSCFFISRPAYSPAGPPPMHVMRMSGSLYRQVPPALSPKPSALDRPSLLQQQRPDAVAQVALDFDRVLDDRAAGAAGALQLAGELLQERLVARQVVDDGHGLAAAPLLLHPQLDDDARGQRFVPRQPAAALAV